MSFFLKASSFFLFCMLVLFSCTPSIRIEKRKYFKGYYIENTCKKNSVLTPIPGNPNHRDALSTDSTTPVISSKISHFILPGIRNYSCKLNPKKSSSLKTYSIKLKKVKTPGINYLKKHSLFPRRGGKAKTLVSKARNLELSPFNKLLLSGLVVLVFVALICLAGTEILIADLLKLLLATIVVIGIIWGLPDKSDETSKKKITSLLLSLLIFGAIAAVALLLYYFF